MKLQKINILLLKICVIFQMANLSPPPSPSMFSMPLNNHQLAASNVIRRASAFNSVLGQKLNVAGMKENTRSFQLKLIYFSPV
jgi:hypothetical protein